MEKSVLLLNHSLFKKKENKNPKKTPKNQTYKKNPTTQQKQKATQPKTNKEELLYLPKDHCLKLV